jgi:hypothetical protein
MTAAVVVVGVSGVGVEDTTVVSSEWFPSLQRLQDRTDLIGFVGGTVDTENVSSRAPACPLLI